MGLARKKFNPKKTPLSEKDFDEINASSLFEKEITICWKKKKKESILLIFDEIERITFGTGSSSHWRDGKDFLYFWQSVRAAFQRSTGVFSFIIAGTNPRCVEVNFVEGDENPLFNAVPIEFLKGFDVHETREMVGKLGRFMGLEFGETTYSKLTEEFGGHPFLIRHACSSINKAAKGKRPFKVDKGVYEHCVADFLRVSENYIEMIVGTLRENYRDEYDLATYLALGDKESFNEFVETSANIVEHLIGYGIINKSSVGYYFNIEAVAEYLRNKSKYQKINLISKRKDWRYPREGVDLRSR